ncbi:MAG TPA: hypothetical protein PK733_19190, partial [Clostridiales bacterium]|nr:hypothetical protein [Clostridiales bacterium]
QIIDYPKCIRVVYYVNIESLGVKSLYFEIQYCHLLVPMRAKAIRPPALGHAPATSIQQV